MIVPIPGPYHGGGSWLAARVAGFGMRPAPAFGKPMGPPLVDTVHGMVVYRIFHKALKHNMLNNFVKALTLPDQLLGGLDA